MGSSDHCGFECYTWSQCLQFVNNDYDHKIQNHLDAPVPWIGMYIAAASAACSLAMAADAFNGFRSKRFWFPCKYFSLNAFSLSILAVTMKLPVDLTSSTLGDHEMLARISSLVLMSTAMGNLMTSLGSMENNELMLNIAALGILVITIAVNVCIHIVQMSYFTNFVLITLAEEVGSIVLMLLLIVTSCSLAVMIPSAKRYIESKYNEMHKRDLNKQFECGKFTVDELRVMVKKYWVMAETGSPQFVMARSAISGTSGFLCLLMALTLVEAYVRLIVRPNYEQTSSNYKWSINWILYIQSIGVALGSIAPLFRWFVATRFKISEIGQKSLRDEFKIENYWTSRLVEWRESSLPLQIRNYRCRKLLHDAKRSVLYICIGVQILVVLASKLVLLISAKLGSAIFMCLHRIKILKTPDTRAPNDITAQLGYVLLLEGEAKLPMAILKNICNEVDKLIQIGEKNQPKNLSKLLKEYKSVNFIGVREFDSKKVPSLHSQDSQEPPNCWSLPVVTLTSIAIALPHMTDNKSNDQLLSAVSEGLSLVKLIEKTLDRNGELESIRNAADMVWEPVELKKIWLDKDLQTTSLNCRTHNETLQELSACADQKIVEYFTSTRTEENPLNWPAKVIAASSMYRITETILLAHKDDEHQTGQKLFDRLSIIISDILAACLTNLGHVITLKCHRNAIKERQESVSQAAILLGESREILEILLQRDPPSLDPEKAANIDEWRAFMEQDNANPDASISASSNNTAILQSNGEHVSIEIEG